MQHLDEYAGGTPWSMAPGRQGVGIREAWDIELFFRIWFAVPPVRLGRFADRLQVMK